MPDVGLLTPGADLAPGSPAAVTDDVALLRAMLRVEAAWVHVLVRNGVAADIQRAASSIGVARIGVARVGQAAAGSATAGSAAVDPAVSGSTGMDAGMDAGVGTGMDAGVGTGMDAGVGAGAGRGAGAGAGIEDAGSTGAGSADAGSAGTRSTGVGSAGVGSAEAHPTAEDQVIDGSGAVDPTEAYPEDIVEIPDAHAHDTADISAVVDAAVERLAGSDDEALALATRLARESGAGGNPVIPLVGALRAAVGPRIAPVVHAGLTSQDVLDTALVLMLRDAAHAVVEDLDQAAVAAARLAAAHRGRPALARTLAQAAVPTTLGARFAGWLQGILAARGFLSSVADALPLAYGGAAGELSGVAALARGTSEIPTAEPPVAGTAHPTVPGTEYPTVGGTAHPTVAGTAHPTVAGTEYPTVGDRAHPSVGGKADSPVGGVAAGPAAGSGTERAAGSGTERVAGSAGAGTSRPELALIEEWGAELGLPVGPGPWHATRTPVVRLGSALAETCAALGKVANDVLQAVRPGVGELREPSGPGRGTSSAMAHKRNPVLSVLVRRSAIAAPHLAAQVLAAAGLAVDERSDGAWHAEWPALQQLARHAVASAHVATELLDGLEVDADAVARNLREGLPAAGPAPDVDPAAAVVDRVLDQFAAQTGPAQTRPAQTRPAQTGPTQTRPAAGRE
ncbi:lyase family protein [Promicromonospora sp. NPDC057488]|uniref:lyase family protein n=1 Tax=Promicromonospora sp. NPDC057488 TaxID=3346147 RepID=UPI00366E4650